MVHHMLYFGKSNLCRSQIHAVFSCSVGYVTGLRPGGLNGNGVALTVFRRYKRSD